MTACAYIGPARSAAEGPAERLGRFERTLLLVLLVLLFALRALYVYRWSIDSDEPQHLHVAWEWTQGHVQYRDFFDNHAPLYHLLMAPLVAAVGETPEILHLARLAMLPLFALTLWAVYRVAGVLFGKRTAAWCALVLAFHYEFFTTSLETRTDVLWTALWWTGLWVLVRAPCSPRRGFAAGLLFGAATATSLKTLLLLASLGGGALFVLLMDARTRRAWPWRKAAATAGSVLAGVLVLPALAVAGFAAAGAARQLYECTLVHSLVPGLEQPTPMWIRLVSAAGIVALVALGSKFLLRSRLAPGDRPRQLLVLLAAAVHAIVLYLLLPFSTRQDALPLEPALALAVVPLFVTAADWVSARRSSVSGRPGAARVGPLLLAAVVGSEILRISVLSPLTQDHTVKATTYVAQSLRLTDPGEYLMDLKGESIFRPRPYYVVLEKYALERIRRGLLEDRVPERLMETNTCVVGSALHRYGDVTRAFLEAHFVPVGLLHVTGSRLGSPIPADTPQHFDLVIAARYAVVRDDGASFQGTLDGARYDGPRDLVPGGHTLVSANPAARVAVIWSRVIERGFTPFGKGEGER